jgi:ABC-type oligopeptide transport system ATPase subunit
MIDVAELSKSYRVHKRAPGIAAALRSVFRRRYETVKAVEELSFRIAEGERVGFLGPNGAGKTTTLKMLSGLLHPTSGNVQVGGHVPHTRDPRFLQLITLVMGQKQQLLWDLPPSDTYAMNRAIYDIPRAQAEALHILGDRVGCQSQLGAQCVVFAWLDFAGYCRCKGEVMACNRKWCQPLSQWRQYFTDCVTAAKPQELLDVNVFFDFRCAHGEVDHVRQLREHLHRLLEGEGKHVFFFHLAQSTLRFRAPLGFFGNIQLESSGEHPAAFNVKAAIIPLVNFARMYALQNSLAETNTLERLRRLRAEGVLLPSSHEELVQAYTALMQMRLAHQAAQIGREAEPDNFIELQELTQLERSMLKRIFADIAVFQARLQTDFARTA